MDAIAVSPIGHVEGRERDVARQDWSRVRSTVRIAPQFEEALLGLEDYSHVIVIGWLDRLPEALRDRRTAYPSGDERLPLQGALALRGARPNPISVSVCRLRKVRGGALEVEGLDLVDGTPVLDVKPYIAFYDSVPEATIPKWAQG